MLVIVGALAAGCSAGPSHKSTAPAAPQAGAPELRPVTAEEVWYRAAGICGQGPYEIEVPVAGARWGEEVELRVATPRRIALHAVIVADADEVAKDDAVYGREGKAGGAAENTRCVAGVRERLAASRGGTGAGGKPGTPAEIGVRVPAPGDPPPREAAVTSQLEIDRGAASPSIVIVRHGWRHHEPGGELRRFARIRIRLWSIEPNDLEGVRFGVRRIEWRPSGSDAEYEAHLARIAAEEEARRRQQEEEARRRQEEERRRRIAESAREDARPRIELPTPVPVDDPAARAERERLRREERKEEEARRRRAEEAERQRRRREAALAERAERQRRREAFCATHPEDRGCWGPGGLRVRRALDERERERGRYCAAHAEDARCWSADELRRRDALSQQRLQVALAPPKQPDGPPPPALAEAVPPKLSANAEWRSGYWQWTGKDWVWLAGMWRVPDSDIAAEKTTTAPEAPPPPRTEQASPPPMPGAIWVAGFWQWSGSAWVWVAGSWQARPEAGAAWRPAEWRARGAVHVLIPGAWVRVNGGGR